MTQKKEETKDEIFEGYSEGIHFMRCILMSISTFFSLSIIGLVLTIIFAILNLNIDLIPLINKTTFVFIIIYWTTNMRIGLIENAISDNLKYRPFKIWYETTIIKKSN